jgi:hypothetical protein
MRIRNRLALALTAGTIAVAGTLPFAPAASAQPGEFVHQSAQACKETKRCSHPRASHLRAGEYCKKCAQSFYHRHGYTCKRASDGKLRLFTY